MPQDIALILASHLIVLALRELRRLLVLLWGARRLVQLHLVPVNAVDSAKIAGVATGPLIGHGGDDVETAPLPLDGEFAVSMQ